MIGISEAVEIIVRETAALGVEIVDLSDAVNLVLAERISADTDLPPFDRSQMDGYALRTQDVEKACKNNPARLQIIGESIAGKGFDGELKKTKPSEL
jgi:molybdopterin biosynthesis enzyme